MSEEMYVLAVDGDGAMCVVAARRDLHNTLHGLMCSCSSDWDCCETEGVSEACLTLDDENYWTYPYPDYKPFQWTFRDLTETCPITVTRLTKAIPEIAALKAERDELLRLTTKAFHVMLTFELHGAAEELAAALEPYRNAKPVEDSK